MQNQSMDMEYNDDDDDGEDSDSESVDFTHDPERAPGSINTWFIQGWFMGKKSKCSQTWAKPVMMEHHET